MVELLLVVVILGIVAALAIPSYGRVLEKARIAQAIGDVRAMGQNALQFELENGRVPASLSELVVANTEDPWGNPYVYRPIGSGRGGSVGGARKDRFLVPINSLFDLYSSGPDGQSADALTARSSKDDIVWANDGGFVGLGEQY